MDLERNLVRNDRAATQDGRLVAILAVVIILVALLVPGGDSEVKVAAITAAGVLGTGGSIGIAHSNRVTGNGDESS